MPALAGSGRKRKDPALAAAEGDRSHKGNKPAYSRALIATPIGAPEIPKHLSPGARKIWNELVPILAQDPNLLSVVDYSVLEDFCELYAQKIEIETSMWFDARRAEKEAPKDEKRSARVNVLKRDQKVLDGMRMRLNVLRATIGCTPAARSALKVGPIITSKSVAVDDDLEDAFFNSRMQPM